MRTFEDRQLFWAVLQKFETTIIKLRKHHCHHCQSTPGWGLFLYCIKCANYPSCGEYERQQSPQLLSYPPTFSSSALRHLQSSVTLAHSILTYSQIYQDAGLNALQWCHSQNRRGKLATNCSTSQSFQFHVIKSNHLHWLYSYISTYLSGYRSFWTMRQVA